MEKEFQLLNKIMKLRAQMKCNKFVGAITMELIRKELLKAGLNVSNKNVFIKGLLYELDLLILKKRARPVENLIYLPQQVLVALEIKFRGIYSKSEIKNIKNVFGFIKKINRRIKCIYLTVSENTSYTYWKLEKKLGDLNFLLLERKTDLETALKNNKLYSTGDWNKLIKFLKKLN